jgi:CrcB protein
VTAALFVGGAAVGALVRHLVNQVGLGWIGTLIVNVVGAFALGLLVAVDPGGRSLTVVGAGVLGNLTTFSTFSLEATEGPTRQRATVIGATLVLGFGAAALGYAIG